MLSCCFLWCGDTWQSLRTRLSTAELVGETGLPPPPCLGLLSVLPNNMILDFFHLTHFAQHDILKIHLSQVAVFYLFFSFYFKHFYCCPSTVFGLSPHPSPPPHPSLPPSPIFSCGWEVFYCIYGTTSFYPIVYRQILWWFLFLCLILNVLNIVSFFLIV